MQNLTLLRWFLQRITGILLAIFLTIHIITLHFLPAEIINLENVRNRIQGSSLWLVFYGVFLLTALFHGLNGVYEIIMDYKLQLGLQRTISILLWLIGLIFLILGIKTLFIVWR